MHFMYFFNNMKDSFIKIRKNNGSNLYLKNKPKNKAFSNAVNLWATAKY